MLILKELITLIEKYTADKNNTYYNDILLYLYTKHLNTEEAIFFYKKGSFPIPAYHSFVNQIISPIIEANINTIDNILKQRGRH